jgi:hypothetical protein
MLQGVLIMNGFLGLRLSLFFGLHLIVKLLSDLGLKLFQPLLRALITLRSLADDILYVLDISFDHLGAGHASVVLDLISGNGIPQSLK